MPSWAWVVTFYRCDWWIWLGSFNALMGLSCYLICAFCCALYLLFQCPHGLELLLVLILRFPSSVVVSMPSWAWVVTARISNILNFSWYFLCIPAIYRCILAYLPIFFNQLSKFLRCESPSTFLGTCLSHHSFIIFLVTNTNTLLSGLYLISTKIQLAIILKQECVSMPSRAYTSFLRWLHWRVLGSTGSCQCPLGLIPHFYRRALLYPWSQNHTGVNALSGLYLISTQWKILRILILKFWCQCPLGLIPHFYGTPSKT